MCLSPEVDLAAAVVTGAIAIDTIRRNKNPDARLLAAIPAIFTVHNIASALMWWGLLGKLSDTYAKPAQYFYEFVAFVLWPAYIPYAVRSMESIKSRIKLINIFWAYGLLNAGWHVWRLLRGDIVATAQHHYVSFSFPNDPTLVGIGYVAATCVVIFLSSHRELVVWGVINAVVVAALTIASSNGVPSVWCWWAAVTSIYLNIFIRRHSRRFHQ